VNKGSSVTLTISKGPDTAPVPNVSGQGQTPDQATTTLQGAGFKVQVKEIPTKDQTQDGKVIRQRPQPGTQLKKGRTVVIYVGNFQQTTNPQNPGTPAEPTPTAP